MPPLDFPSFLLGIFMVALIVTLYVLCEEPVTRQFQSPQTPASSSGCSRTSLPVADCAGQSVHHRASRRWATATPRVNRPASAVVGSAVAHRRGAGIIPPHPSQVPVGASHTAPTLPFLGTPLRRQGRPVEHMMSVVPSPLVVCSTGRMRVPERRSMATLPFGVFGGRGRGNR